MLEKKRCLSFSKSSPIYREVLCTRERRTPATEEGSTRPSAQPHDGASANIFHESPSPVDVETGVDSNKTTSGGDTEILQIDEDQGKYVDNQVNLEENTIDLDQGQARSNPGKTPESRPLPEHEFIEEDQAGQNPGEPLSSSGTLSSIKNLDDAYTFGDQFLNDKSTEDELGKLNTDSKVVSMVTVSSSVFLALEQKFAAFEQKSKPLDNTTQNLGSRVFNLELQDLPHKIDQTVNTVVKEAVHIALQALLRDRFRELPEADMKEILYQRMFENGSCKSLPEHALYKALEASMDQANRDKFLAKKDKS
nr:hypothetical protein [Tanacetum cinerariifolium]